MKRRLIVSDGQRERELLLVGTIVVGRDPSCDVSEDGDALLSRRHTEFVAGPEGVMVRDLGSRNGTFVNGVRIAESAVRAGDIVHIGNLRVRYVEDDRPATIHKPAPPPPVEVDDEVTRIVRAAKPSPPRVEPGPAAEAAPPPASTPISHVNDDDRTVVTPKPGQRAVARDASDDEANDDQKTVFVKVPARSAAPAAAPAAAQPTVTPSVEPAAVPAAEAPSAVRRAPARSADSESMASFVSVQITLVAAIVFVSVLVALVVGRSELLTGPVEAIEVAKWLGLPVVITCLAAYRASRAIKDRIARVMTADNGGGREV